MLLMMVVRTVMLIARRMMLLLHHIITAAGTGVPICSIPTPAMAIVSGVRPPSARPTPLRLHFQIQIRLNSGRAQSSNGGSNRPSSRFVRLERPPRAATSFRSRGVASSGGTRSLQYSPRRLNGLLSSVFRFVRAWSTAATLFHGA